MQRGHVLGLTAEEIKFIRERSPAKAAGVGIMHAYLRRYDMCNSRAVHFVGFRGDEYVRAVRVFGKPDFIHRVNDPRFRHGGEIGCNDIVVYANESESKVTQYSFDDSSVR